MTDLLSRFAADPRVYPQQLDVINDTVLLVQLSEAERRDHSFLDQRVLRHDIPFQWVRWGEFFEVASAAPAAVPAYLFHIGHCGSTLVSRLAAAASGTYALREPLPLRTFAADRVEGNAGLLGAGGLRARLRVFERAWARGSGRTAVKATSICTNLIDIVDSEAPVVFMYQDAATHLAVILAGENAWQDLRGFGQHRYRRLQAQGANLPALASLSIGQLAGMSWLSEMSSTHACLASRAALRVDFDEFLDRPAESLAEICAHLGLSTTIDDCQSTVAGTIMQAYSKAPEHDYGPELRRQVIADSKRRNAAEIAKGLELIERFRSTTCGEDWH